MNKIVTSVLLGLLLQVCSFDEPVYNAKCDRVAAVMKSAGLVFVGEVVSVGQPPPPGMAGYFMPTQSVTYKVIRSLKGEVSTDTIIVMHDTAGGSRNSKEGKLATKIFYPGNRLIVTAALFHGESYVEVDSHLGVIKASARNVEAVESLLK